MALITSDCGATRCLGAQTARITSQVIEVLEATKSSYVAAFLKVSRARAARSPLWRIPTEAVG